MVLLNYMVFGLFGNNEGKALLNETIRTLDAADQLSDKNKKVVSNHTGLWMY